jgi:hypothetical protein
VRSRRGGTIHWRPLRQHWQILPTVRNQREPRMGLFTRDIKTINDLLVHQQATTSP